MPRVNKLIRPDLRELQLVGDIGRFQKMTGMSFKQLCKKAGVQYETFMRHLKNPRTMRYGEYWQFVDACKREIGGEIEL